MTSFTWHIGMSTKAVTALFGCYTAGAMRNCRHFGARSVYTIQPCTSLQCHFIRRHIRKLHVTLVLTSHRHFWQNDRDLLRATAVTRGRTSQHKKLTLEKTFYRHSCRDSNLRLFDHVSGVLPLSYPRFPDIQYTELAIQTE